MECLSSYPVRASRGDLETLNGNREPRSPTWRFQIPGAQWNSFDIWSPPLSDPLLPACCVRPADTFYRGWLEVSSEWLALSSLTNLNCVCYGSESQPLCLEHTRMKSWRWKGVERGVLLWMDEPSNSLLVVCCPSIVQIIPILGTV